MSEKQQAKNKKPNPSKTTSNARKNAASNKKIIVADIVKSTKWADIENYVMQVVNAYNVEDDDNAESAQECIKQHKKVLFQLYSVLPKLDTIHSIISMRDAYNNQGLCIAPMNKNMFEADLFEQGDWESLLGAKVDDSVFTHFGNEIFAAQIVTRMHSEYEARMNFLKKKR